MKRRPLPPPEKLTATDVGHIILGVLMIPLGLVILYQALTRVRTATAFVVSLCFLAFGLYRVTTAASRYALLRRSRAKTRV
jgi:fucose permease